MNFDISTVLIGTVSAVFGALATLIGKKFRSQDSFDQLVDARVTEHMSRLDEENDKLRTQNKAFADRIAALEGDHFRIRQLELSVRMLSDALGRIDPDNSTLAMVRILFATMYDRGIKPDEPEQL